MNNELKIEQQISIDRFKNILHDLEQKLYSVCFLLNLSEEKKDLILQDINNIWGKIHIFKGELNMPL